MYHCKTHLRRNKRFACERLEDRRLLAVITVDTLVDEADGSIIDGDISLRDAIDVAAAGDTIAFDRSLDGGTILLTLGELAITESLSVDATMLPAGLTIDASGNDPTPNEDHGDGSRVFNINDGDGDIASEVTISGLTLTGGDIRVMGFEPHPWGGGAIYSREELTIISSTISDNRGGPGSGISSFGRSSELRIIESTISDNRSGLVLGIAPGGAIFGASLTITGSTISGNTFAGVSGQGAVTVVDSTISGNSAAGIIIRRSGATVTITDSTISGNTASLGGYAGDGIHGEGDDTINVTITNSTVSENGGHGLSVGGTVTVANSIFSDNGGSDIEISPYSPSVTVSHSLIGDDTGMGWPEAPVGMPDEDGNLIGDPDGMGIIDPLLSPLGNFGGPTQTHALLPGSPAINMGDPNFPEPSGFDQRGEPFLRVSDGRVDMGAFETQIAPVDFNDDDRLDGDDADMLVAAIVDGSHEPAFDLTGDAFVDQADLDTWLALAGMENLPTHQAYPPGDANMDGIVDARDLNIVGLNWRQDVTGWSSGDFTADGQVDAMDLNLLGLNWRKDVSGAAAAHQRVPRAPLAPLADQVVAVMAATELDDSRVLTAASKPKFAFDDVSEKGEFASPDYVARHALRPYSTRIASRAEDVVRPEEINRESLVDLVLERWAKPADR